MVVDRGTVYVTLNPEGDGCIQVQNVTSQREDLNPNKWRVEVIECLIENDEQNRTSEGGRENRRKRKRMRKRERGGSRV